MSPELITAGDIFVDLIMSGFDEWPEPGKEVFATHFQREVGGGAVITACGLAKLRRRVAVLGIVGADNGDWIVGRLREKGVDTNLIQFDAKESTACTVIATGSKDRAFLTYMGTSRGFENAMKEAVRSRRLTGALHVHLAFAPSFDSGIQLIEDIQGDGATVSLDVGWRPDWLSHSSALELLRKVDIFFPNESEGCRLTAEKDVARVLERFSEAGVARVALKLGSSGAALSWDGRTYFADAYPAAAVDTTGAGDSFDAGFLHAWLNGEGPETSLRTATICGALSTEAFGGINGFPGPERLQAELKRAS